MTAKAGKLQATFKSGELAPAFAERVGLEYFNSGLGTARNIELLPQGGFTVAAGLRYIGPTDADAMRLFPFQSNDGNIYDLIFNDQNIEVWGETSKLYQFAHGYSVAQVPMLVAAQLLDTMVLFEKSRAPQRLLNGGPTTWIMADAPLENIPTYDYGAIYTNGVAAEWEIEFIGFHTGNAPYWDNLAFVITVNGIDSLSVRAVSTAPTTGTTPDMAATSNNVLAAVQSLPNVGAGITASVTSSGNPYRIKIKFEGAGNLGDQWALSARVLNKPDAAVLCSKVVVGVEPGEAIISNARGWPRCGSFYQQRLLMGGLKALPNSWMASITGDPFNFNTELNTAAGSFVVPLDTPGGEAVRQIVNNQFLLIMTSSRTYWVAGSATGLSKLVPPKHIPASDHGVAEAVPVVSNERAALLVHDSGDSITEMRYTDIDGNYTTQDVTLIAAHLMNDIRDIAITRKSGIQSANQAAIVNDDGSLRLGYLLREKEVTGFVRYDSDAAFKAVCANGRNDTSFILDKGGVRSLERLESDLLLQHAKTYSYAVPVCDIYGLDYLEGREVWCLGDGHVLGPFTVYAGHIGLPVKVQEAIVGTWRAPEVVTLPLSRMVGPDIWYQKKARIHSVQIFVEDTTSIAVGANGGKTYDQALRKFGDKADVPELYRGYSGLVTVRGLMGFTDRPTLTITQHRPGRLTVRSIVAEATI
jgi:hypothetical protein